MAITTKEFLTGRMEHFLRTRVFEEQHSKQKSFAPSLTISRQSGAGMSRIRRDLIDYLDEVDDTDGDSWALFDQSLVGKVIEENNLEGSVEKYLVENTKFPVMDVLETTLNLHPSEWTLFNYTANTIRKICRAGYAVVVGRAGNFVTSDLPNTFHIRLVGAKENRIKEIGKQFDTSDTRARDIVEQTDLARKKYVKRYTGSKIDDPGFYDVVINTNNLNDALLVRVIGDSLLEWANEKEKTETRQ